MQGFKIVRAAQLAAIALAAVLAFGLAAALGQGTALVSRASACLVAGKPPTHFQQSCVLILSPNPDPCWLFCGELYLAYSLPQCDTTKQRGSCWSWTSGHW